MELSPIKLKITLLVSAIDRNKKINDLSSYKFLLPISTTVDTLPDDNEHENILKSIFTEYLHYDYDDIYKSLASVRSQIGLLEICYFIQVPYIKGFNKQGKIFTLDDFNNGDVILEKYYEEIYERCGSGSGIICR